MPMRRDCKFYESRTYPSGESVRMCRLDLAPEAPWRCPENCSGFQRKVSDAGFVKGSLADTTTASDDEPELDENAISMLDSAEDIINEIGPGIISQVQEERDAARRRSFKRRRWWPFK